MLNNLPIEAIKADFITALVSHNTLVLSAPPGAGKSTCLPLWLLELPAEALAGQKIYLLQPRRVAAKNIACFLAQQLGEKVGERVGYRLRNEKKVSHRTQIEVITEGILTQIIQNDAELSNCGLIILDEFHERSLHGDLAFALARDIQQGLRDDLKILLMSATLAIDSLLTQLPDAIALKSEGRSYSVDLEYQPPSSSRMWREHALSVIKQTASTHQGSILVFLPGASDIRFLAERLAEHLPHKVLLCPLFGELSLAEQQQAIAPAKPGLHKLVLATNIAETSLTIEGVNLVIDCGLEKVARYEPQTMTNRLSQQAISKASAIQRAGRAGRLMPGSCIRLYSEEDFNRRNADSTSEIQQADLLPLLIESARWGVSQLSDLPFIEYPQSSKENGGWFELTELNIVNQNRRLTTHGKAVSLLSCHPRFAHMICQAKALEQQQQGLTGLACLLAAMLEERDVFTGPQAQFDCDLRHRVIELQKHQGKARGNYQRIWQQAKRLQQQAGSRRYINNDQIVAFTGVLLALAYPERIAQQRKNSHDYLAKNGKGFSMHSDDALANHDYIVAANVSAVNHKLTIRSAAPVDIALLQAWQLAKVTEHSVLAYDSKSDKIVAEQQSKLGAIVLKKQSLTAAIRDDERAALWSQQLKNQGIDWLNFSNDAQLLLKRWRWCSQYCLPDDFPQATEQALLATTDIWFNPFVGEVKSKAQLNKLNFSEMCLSLLTYPQQQVLAKLAPSHFIGPTGRRCAIRYSDEKSPTVSLPMQELYGQKITPSVGGNAGNHASGNANNKAIPLILELLSPAQRPIQVTQDLAMFWQGSYKAVQKEMKSSYPKHFWPDDPANAQPTNKTKRHLVNKQ